MSKYIFRASDVPNSFKIALYDALAAHLVATLDTYYTPDVPADPRYDTGEAQEHPTEILGMQIDRDSLEVVVAIKGWADAINFSVELPTLLRDDAVGEGFYMEIDTE